MRADDDTIRRTTRYTIVGVVCAATYNAIMILGSKAGGDYVSLSLLAFVVVTPLGYLLHAGFTFGVRRSWTNFARFVSSVAVSFPINFVVIAGLCSGLHLSVVVAAPITTVVMYIWNYASTHWALLRWLPFGKKSYNAHFTEGFEGTDVPDNPTPALSAISE